MKKVKNISTAKKSKIAVTVKKAVNNKKAKVSEGMKTKVTAKKAAKVEVVKKTIRPAKKATKMPVYGKTQSHITAKTKSIVKKETMVKPPVVPETIIHGEDLHLIPTHNEIHPLTTLEVHQKENLFHHHEEVAFHQENQKVKAAMPSRKSNKNTYRKAGRR